MNFSEIGRKLGLGRSRKPISRSKSLISIAESLESLAYGLRIVILREYNIDIAAPRATRDDLTREVFDPLWASNEEEAIREERERIEALEADLESPDTRDAIREAAARRSLALRRVSGADASDADMTPEERAFLATLEESGRTGSSGEPDV